MIRIAREVCATLAILITTLTCETSNAASLPPPWSERGVFVFGRITLDFWKRMELFAGPTGLENCSTSKFYCAEAYITHIALPRGCEGADHAQVGTTWRVGDVRTTVLRIFDEPRTPLDPHIPMGSGHVLLLGDSQYPNTVYEYDTGMGVKGIFFDAANKVNFVQLAQANSDLSSYRDLDHYYGLQTFDPFGSCAN